MLLLAFILPGVSMLVNGRIISGILAIILQVVACLTFLVFGIGFLLWLILVIWAINVRSKAKSEKKFREREITNGNSSQKVLVQEKTFTPEPTATKPLNKDNDETIKPVQNEKLNIKFKPILYALGGLILIGVSYFFYSIIFTADFSNPLKVLKETERQWRENDLKNYYTYLTKKSQKTYKSFEEFKKKKTIPDSVLKTYKTLSIAYYEIPLKDIINFKKFKVSVTALEGKDTVKNEYFRTLFNEDGKWKLTWNKEIIKNATALFEKGDFSKATDEFYNAIEIDPFSISARTQIVWCYLRDSERPKFWQDTSVYHLNFLLETDSTNSDVYNAVGAFYSNLKQNEKAVSNFLYAAKYAKDSTSIANLYSNAAQNARVFSSSKAEKYLDKSLGYNKNSRFTWQTYGDILYSSKMYSNAREKYEKAIELVSTDKNIDNFTLINLYGYYALTCKKLGDQNKAEEYVVKCVRVYPDKKHPVFKELNL